MFKALFFYTFFQQCARGNKISSRLWWYQNWYYFVGYFHISVVYVYLKKSVYEANPACVSSREAKKRWKTPFLASTPTIYRHVRACDQKSSWLWSAAVDVEIEENHFVCYNNAIPAYAHHIAHFITSAWLGLINTWRSPASLIYHNRLICICSELFYTLCTC